MTAKVPFTFTARGYYTFRRGKGANMVVAQLPGQPGDAEFEAEYARLVAMTDALKAGPVQTTKVDRNSLTWLIGRYLESAEFAVLAPATRLDYEKMFKWINTTDLAKEQFQLVTKAMVKDLRDKVAKGGTPRKAGKVKAMLSLLYTYAQDESLVDDDHNPALGLRKLKHKAEEIQVWSDEEIALFLDGCPDWLARPVLLALYTGQRREDVVAMQWSAFQGAVIRCKQSKTNTPLDITCHPELAACLAKVDVRRGNIVRNAKGKPMLPNALSQAIRRRVNDLAAMPKNRSIHGLRYAAACRLEEAGVTAFDIASLTGHRAYQMGIKYASQRKRNAAAIAQQVAYEADQQAKG